MNVFITGGAGYIGSFMTKYLLDQGMSVVVFDNLQKGHTSAIDTRAKFIEGDILNSKSLDAALSQDKFDAVIHFAAYISMVESMREPGEYFRTNVLGSINVLEAILHHTIKNIVFSSTAGVYGNPQTDTLAEDHRKLPENPYGESKWMVEKVLEWYQKIHGINSVSLRYFNAAGAAQDGSMGEQHTPETHLIPNVINAILYDREFTLYGTDYDTLDGTCVRDYIHVLDLAEAHALALKKIMSDSGSFVYNVGTGNGYSNKEVVAMVEAVSGKKCQVITSDRRPGDASKLVANATKITREILFQPKYSDLRTIVSTAWLWHKSRYEKQM